MGIFIEDNFVFKNGLLETRLRSLTKLKLPQKVMRPCLRIDRTLGTCLVEPFGIQGEQARSVGLAPRCALRAVGGGRDEFRVRRRIEQLRAVALEDRAAVGDRPDVHADHRVVE